VDAIIERPVGAAASTSKPIRIVRVIARLNMGGPAQHVGLLGSGLDPDRYETLLLHGDVGAGEDSLEEFVRDRGATMARVPGLRPELRPQDDARALGSLVRTIRGLRPDIVDTHTAKGGMLGRLAAVIAGEPRPKIVHTYHGHVLEGYFGAVKNATYRGLERRLATVSDALIGVSSATVDDLVRLGIAPRKQFRVIPIGVDLAPFLDAAPADGAAFRAEAGVEPDEVLLTFVGRLVPIKRVDVLLRALAHARAEGANVRLAVVGDGALRSQLERLAAELGVGDRVWFAGYRADMVSVAAASDIAVLSSDNEGTPVSLIEAAAARTPAVATSVGGVPDVVTAETGLLAPATDFESLGRAIAALAADPEGRAKMSAAARQHVAPRFSVARLVSDMDSLYSELLQPGVRLPLDEMPSGETHGAMRSSNLR
jgi:glycosyltransferase involved in cell wall biosynthesis